MLLSKEARTLRLTRGKMKKQQNRQHGEQEPPHVRLAVCAEVRWLVFLRGC
jgi:hypothetical protein